MEIPYTTTPRRDTGLYNAKVGIWLFLASEVMLFGALFSSYVLLRVGADFWPAGMLNIPIGTFNTFVLITSSVTVVLCWANLKLRNFSRAKMYLALTILCALAFLGIKTKEYNDKFTHYQINFKDNAAASAFLTASYGSDDVEVQKAVWAHTYGHVDETRQLPELRYLPITGHLEGKPRFLRLKDVQGQESIQFVADPLRIPKAKGTEAAAHGDDHAAHPVKVADLSYLSSYVPSHNTYFAIYFTLTGLHAAHVLGGALVMAYLLFFGGRMWRHDPDRLTNRVEVAGLFWHFVDLVWIFLFPVLYLL